MSKTELYKFLKEDIGSGDITSSLLPKIPIKAEIISRENGIVAGVHHIKEMFQIKNCKVQIHTRDGQKIKRGQKILNISGTPQNVLSCERTALNLLSRMSGIATDTKKIVDRSKCDVYATRKTAPGLRTFDKEAVEIGGGKRHRMKLDEMVMIKDNHIAVSGLQIIHQAKKKYKKIEVEVDTIKDAMAVAGMGVKIIMLDNFSHSMISKTVQELKKKNIRNKIILEASGGINKNNVTKISSMVDRVSVGAITNSVHGIDFSLQVI